MNTISRAAVAAAVLALAPALAHSQGPGAGGSDTQTQGGISSPSGEHGTYGGAAGATGVGAQSATVGSTGEVITDPSSAAADISPYATVPAGQGATTEAAGGFMASGGDATASGMSAYGQTYPYQQSGTANSTSGSSDNPYAQTFPYGEGSNPGTGPGSNAGQYGGGYPTGGTTLGQGQPAIGFGTGAAEGSGYAPPR